MKTVSSLATLAGYPAVNRLSMLPGMTPHTSSIDIGLIDGGIGTEPSSFECLQAAGGFTDV